MWALGARLDLPKGPRRMLGSGYLPGWSNKAVLCALKRQGSWSGRAWWVPELEAGAELSLPQEEGELDRT